VLGILNCTPDSFSDGGRYLNSKSAIERALTLLEEGADGIDIGAESTRPGSEALSPQAEWQRLEPWLSAFCDRFDSLAIQSPILSIDTRNAETARKALAVGVHMINDVSGGRHDPQMLPLIAESGCPFVLMHMRGTPQTMGSFSDYGENFLSGLLAQISDDINRALDHGVKPQQMILDPGIGFSKTASQNLEIMAHLDTFHCFGYPLLLGPSRKSCLREPFAQFSSQGFTEKILDINTLGAVTCAILKGVHWVRVHNVKDLLPGIRLADCLARGGMLIEQKE
jgi:dihydropteroate synthase